MAFSKAARFPGREFSTPGPGSYSPNISPRVCAYTFGQKSRLRNRDTPTMPVVDIANLELTNQLGSGGLATVFTGFHDGRRIAFKQYRHNPHVCAIPEEDRKALLTEATLLQRLQHPNVVKVLSIVVDHNKTSGYTMQQLGKSLDKVNQTRQLSARRLDMAFRQTCTAVAYVHTMLVAHLDIRPANICFSSPLSYSSVKLIDFDSAKELKTADELLDRFGGNLAGSSWEKANNQPCRALAEDVHMRGHTFLGLLKEQPADAKSEQLRARMRARVMPLLRRAAQRPSMQQALDSWDNPVENVPEQEDPLPTLLLSAPTGLLAKLFR